MQFTIEIPDTVEFRRAGHDMRVDMTQLPSHIIAELAQHGLVQTVGDAAAGASAVTHEALRQPGETEWGKLSRAQRNTFTEQNAGEIAKIGKELMDKRFEALSKGEWTRARQAAAGMSPVEERCADLLIPKMEFEKGTTKAAKRKQALAAFGELGTDMQAKVRGLAESQLAEERKQAEAVAALDIDLTSF